MEFASCAMGSCVDMTVGNKANNTRMKKLSIAINTVIVHMYDFNVSRKVFCISLIPIFNPSYITWDQPFCIKYLQVD